MAYVAGEVYKAEDPQEHGRPFELEEDCNISAGHIALNADKIDAAHKKTSDSPSLEALWNQAIDDEDWKQAEHYRAQLDQ